MSINELVNKVMKDIKYTIPVKEMGGSNEIEPTQKMVKEVIQNYVNGMGLEDIKNTVKKDKTNLKLSFNQINEIIKEYKLQYTQKEVIEDEILKE